jgi:hypothetical protein
LLSSSQRPNSVLVAIFASDEEKLMPSALGRPLQRGGDVVALITAMVSALGMAASFPAYAQNRANVVVDLGKTVNMLTDTSLGLPAISFDANSYNEAGAMYLRAAGISALRFPGDHTVADLYHWSSRKASAYGGANAPYHPPESNFASFALLAEELGQGVVVVNYGTNQNGTGGGEPAEAAALVAYANGTAGDARDLGKDSAGVDWHTVGYWAALRGQAPLPTDDGLNFLRIQHPRPFGFKLWQAGDELYNNGYYGRDHSGAADLHAPAPSDSKDFGRLKGNPKLSPAAYAENFNVFAQHMKAVDPSIHMGAAFTLPPNPDPTSHEWAPDWNREVLKGACANLDFITLGWSMQPLLPPDWKTLDEASLLRNHGYNQANVIDLLVESMLDNYKRYCPAGHLPRLAFAPAAIATWVKVEHPVVKALWVADFYALLVESGSANINWNEMYGDSTISADRKNFGSVFYGLQMLHTIAHAPGDLLMDTRSNSLTLAAHAAARRDGFVGLMLINKDPKNSTTVKVTFKNGLVGNEGRRIDYGNAQLGAGVKPTVAPYSATGDEFTVTVPPYTITDLLVPAPK